MRRRVRRGERHPAAAAREDAGDLAVARGREGDGERARRDQVGCGGDGDRRRCQVHPEVAVRAGRGRGGEDAVVRGDVPAVGAAVLQLAGRDGVDGLVAGGRQAGVTAGDGPVGIPQVEVAAYRLRGAGRAGDVRLELEALRPGVAEEGGGGGVRGRLAALVGVVRGVARGRGCGEAGGEVGNAVVGDAQGRLVRHPLEAVGVGLVAVDPEGDHARVGPAHRGADGAQRIVVERDVAAVGRSGAADAVGADQAAAGLVAPVGAVADGGARRVGAYRVLVGAAPVRRVRLGDRQGGSAEGVLDRVQGRGVELEVGALLVGG